MKVKLQILKNLLDHTQIMYQLIDIPSRTIDNIVYVPVIESPGSRKLQWVRKDAYEAKGSMEVEVNG
jgi:hypothetical protein